MRYYSKLLIFISFLFLIYQTVSSEPNVLVCKKNCGMEDLDNEYNFQARMMEGLDPGGNVTFIEDDIIISEAHVFAIDRRKACCTPEETKKYSEIWKKKKLYIVAGNTYHSNKKIIGEIINISARNTGEAPGYDLIVAHVDRNCKKCNTEIKIDPIPLANFIPVIGTKATHVCVADRKKWGNGIIYDDHTLNGWVYGGEGTQCSRQIVKHDGITNPPMMFAGCSGSPVIYKECGKDVIHGLHGNGMDEDKIMYEMLQLVQTQKKWIQQEIYNWTGRTDMLDACSETGRRSFMDGNKFEIKQNDCISKICKEDCYENPIPCDQIDLDESIKFPWHAEFNL